MNTHYYSYRTVIKILFCVLMFYGWQHSLQAATRRTNELAVLVSTSTLHISETAKNSIFVSACFSPIWSDSPEHKIRVLEQSFSINAPTLWRCTGLNYEYSDEKHFLFGNASQRNIFRLSRYNDYYRTKARLLDIGDDNTVFMDFRWATLLVGKGISSRSDSWQAGSNDRRSKRQFCVYGDILAGVGIASYLPYSSQLTEGTREFYTGMETTAEAEVTMRYYGMYLQPSVQWRHIISRTPLTQTTLSISATVFVFGDIEFFANYSRNWFSFNAHHQIATLFRSGIRLRI